MKQHKKETKTTSTGAKKGTVPPEERQHMITEAAYYRAEQRGFQGGNSEQDWLESEVEIDRSLTACGGRRNTSDSR